MQPYDDMRQRIEFLKMMFPENTFCSDIISGAEKTLIGIQAATASSPTERNKYTTEYFHEIIKLAPKNSVQTQTVAAIITALFLMDTPRR